MNSHLTAIARKKLPNPVLHLIQREEIVGHVLDYGCGKCAALNEDELASVNGVKSVLSYDPFYSPHVFKMDSPFDTILCTYVLCTLPKSQEKQILRHIQNLLAPMGLAFITVRNDRPKNGYGKNSRGTFQRKVELPYLQEYKKTSQYRIYLLTPKSIIE